MKQMTSPCLPGWEYVADGEPHVFGDRLYLFGSHDRFGGNRFCLNDYVGWSAPLADLSDWRCEGVTYRRTQDPDNRDGKLELWAPDVCQGPDGRFYLYYCLANHPKLSVAVSDRPAGHYEFLGYVRDSAGRILGQRDGDTRPFDPAVLVDDDGRIHLYAGQGPLNRSMAKKRAKTHRFVYHMELEPDMLTLKGEPAPLLPNVETSAGTGFEGHEFFEASSIRKWAGRYYFIYSSVLSHELCWAVSNRPDGGFRYGGTLISNGDIGLEGPVPVGYNSKANPAVKNYIGNNHGSVEKVNGSYYVFYHRHTNRNMCSRQACAAKIELLPDGSFRQAEMTSIGLGEPFPVGQVIEARTACQLSSGKGCVYSAHPMVQNKKHPAFTQEEPDGESGPQYIGNLRDGAKAVYKYVNLQGAASVSVTFRGNCRGAFTIQADGRLLATLPVNPQKVWSAASARLPEVGRTAAIAVTYHGRGYADLLNLSFTGRKPEV